MTVCVYMSSCMHICLYVWTYAYVPKCSNGMYEFVCVYMSALRICPHVYLYARVSVCFTYSCACVHVIIWRVCGCAYFCVHVCAYITDTDIPMSYCDPAATGFYQPGEKLQKVGYCVNEILLWETKIYYNNS
jgi:hypothetical protein